MSDFPDTLGVIGVGDEVVLPGPAVGSSWNLSIRDYEDRTFRWGMVTGAYPDPDLGYVFNRAESYRLEITPDVGMTDIDEMFTVYSPGLGIGNGRLRIIDNLTVGTELTDVGDESVTFQVPLEDMYRILAPGFDRYLWRVVAIDDDGQSGHPSELQGFRGRVVVPSVAWTVNPATDAPRSPTYTVTGTRTPQVSKIELNDSDSWVSYPSPTTWEAEVPLDGGRNVFFVRAFDAQGNGSEYRQVEISTTNNALTEGTYYNRFDDFGFQMSLPRLPGERNASYRSRIRDVSLHRASPLYDGLMNAFGRELNLDYIDQGLVIRAAEFPETGRREAVRVWCTSSYFYVQTGRMAHRSKYVRPDGNTWRAELDKYVVGEVTVEQPFGMAIDAKHFVLEEEDGVFTVRFLTPDYALNPVYVSYNYAERISKHGRTVSEVYTDLDAMTEAGAQILDVTLNPAFTGVESSNGFQSFKPIRVDLGPWLTAGKARSSKYPVRWIDAELCPFMEEDLRDRYLNEYGSLFNTEYSGWALRVKAQLHTTWGFLIADKNLWSHPQLVSSGVGSLPTHWDMFTGSWTTTGTGPQFSTRSAWPRNFIHPSDRSYMQSYGIPRLLMYSGIGDSHDLQFLVEERVKEHVPAVPSVILHGAGSS